MNELNNNINQYVSRNPQIFGIFFSLFGLVFLISAVKDAHWLFGNPLSGDYNLRKIDGWINFFGRKPARIMVGFTGFIMFLGGLLWFWAYTSFYK